MSTETSHKPGNFSWVDLATTDTAGAERFYSSLFGWSADHIPVGEGMTYSIFKLKAQPVAGMHAMGEQQSASGMPPNWMSYVAVEDADSKVARAAELGATVIMPAMDVMTAGRMAVLQDPTGAFFALWQPKDHAGAGLVNETGAMIWNELMSKDGQAAEQFYNGLFGWTTDKMDMGHMVYTVFKNGDERGFAGMLQITPEMGGMPSNWVVYFAVDDTNATAEKVTSLGGKVMMPPTEIPNVGVIAYFFDPQDGMFAVIEPRGM